MNFERPMSIQLTGKEVALIWMGLSELKAGLSFDLMRKLEILDAMQEEQANKAPAPDLKLVSQQ